MVRVQDDTGLFDQHKIRLRIHPINDPPIIEDVSDKRMHMNNPIYPNDINVVIKKIDVEETDNLLSILNFEPFKPSIVDTNYCERVRKTCRIK